MKFKAYYLLLISSLILLILGFLEGEETFDINVYDIYFVIANCHLYWLFSIFFLFFFLIYIFFDFGKVELIKILSKLHIFGSLFSLLIFIFPCSLIYDQSNFKFYDEFLWINIIVTISFLVLLFLQLLFIINMVVSLIKRMKLFRASRFT
jgi:heme/copper-type cytochrome/quinol oxidase subunit 1